MALSDDLHQAPALDHPDLEDHSGPGAGGDPMGTPAANEKVLWKGQPDLTVLARTAFHTRSVAIYFVILIGLALAFGNTAGAITCAILGVIGLAVLQLLAWQSARTTLYIITDQRLIMRIGMALETRINVPLKHIGAADLKPRGKGIGDIALQLNGDRLLGYLLLWPHARAWKLAHPQPMLRGVPEAETVAKTLADAVAAHAAIERDGANANAKEQVNGPAPARDARPAADHGLEGMPA